VIVDAVAVALSARQGGPNPGLRPWTARSPYRSRRRSPVWRGRVGIRVAAPTLHCVGAYWSLSMSEHARSGIEHRTAYDLATGLYRQWRDRLGENDENTRATAHYLALAQQNMGRYAEARELVEDTLARSRRILGGDHPNTLTSASNLAADLRAWASINTA
jgi:Tetratricopeptide repeat